ncbi:MAG: hypothetical protein NW224_16960 [Leptolyngbyaceae cyanobacterium bins.302]|nr:hypothetical protein [Leptolyngbyaceae cyanobacterium bins.302]
MEIPAACTLSQTDLSNRQKELNALQQAVCEVRQTLDGFALRFDSSTENLMAIAHVIAKERLCCRFLRFQLIAEPGAGPLWLEVSGPDNTFQLLLEMFGFGETCSKSPTSSSGCSS